MVLRVYWSRTIRPILWNFADLTMEFYVEGNKVVLRGLSSCQLMETHAVNLMAKGEKRGVLLQLIEPMLLESVAELPDIQEVLQEYEVVFTEPIRLPPIRYCDHSIPLKEGTSPVFVRPYIYPFYQKEKIKKIVRELLSSRVIRISQSLFSSPVLLVKKAGGCWRMCVDYRALN